MPLPAIVPIIAGILSSAGQIWNSQRLAKRQTADNRASIDANKQLSELAYSRDVEMWNKQNEYNAPGEQMQRLTEANLNPNLMYQTGSSGNQTGPAPAYHPPQVEYSTGVTNLPDVLGMYQNFQSRQAQINQMEAQTENIEAKTATEKFNTTLKEILGTRAGVDLAQTQQLNPYSLDIKQQEAQQSQIKTDANLKSLMLLDEDQKIKVLQQLQQRANIENIQSKTARERKSLNVMDLEMEKKQAEILYMKYKNQWREMGVTDSDNVLMRIMVRMLSEAGLGMEDLNPFK